MSRSEVLDTIRSRVGEENLSRSHRREGCRVYLDGLPSQRLTVDADLAFPANEFEGSRCDLILFLFDSDGKLVTVPTELKGGNVSASEVHEQLQQGANFAIRVALQGIESECLPMLFYGKRIHPKQLRALNRLKVIFRGQRLTVKIARCNRPGNLALALRG